MVVQSEKHTAVHFQRLLLRLCRECLLCFLECFFVRLRLRLRSRFLECFLWLLWLFFWRFSSLSLSGELDCARLLRHSSSATPAGGEAVTEVVANGGEAVTEVVANCDHCEALFACEPAARSTWSPLMPGGGRKSRGRLEGGGTTGGPKVDVDQPEGRLF